MVVDKLVAEFEIIIKNSDLDKDTKKEILKSKGLVKKNISSAIDLTSLGYMSPEARSGLAYSLVNEALKVFGVIMRKKEIPNEQGQKITTLLIEGFRKIIR